LAKLATSGFGLRFGFTGDFADGVLVGVMDMGEVDGDGKWESDTSIEKEDAELVYSVATHIQDEFSLTLSKAQKLFPDDRHLRLMTYLVM
jgi:hypothetical protein